MKNHIYGHWFSETDEFINNYIFTYVDSNLKQ